MISDTALMLTVTESSQVAATRRIASEIAQDLGFGQELAGVVALVATEAATNLVKHAKEGRIQLRAINTAGEMTLELLAIDAGPGMQDVDASLTDGYSTTNTPGTGLGAIRRLSSEFDIYSQPGKGTVLLGRWAADRREHKVPEIRAGVVQVPARGERVCGDAWSMVRDGDTLTVIVADGLGHGPLAAEAAQAAVRVVEQSSLGLDPAGILRQIHAALRPTRGAAVAIAQINLKQLRMLYAGVGNISGLIATSAGTQRLVSHNGTAGAEARRIQQFDYDWPATSLLIMFSDGLSSNWDWRAYPGLRDHDPAIVAGVLYRDHNRGRDDATVAVVKGAA